MRVKSSIHYITTDNATRINKTTLENYWLVNEYSLVVVYLTRDSKVSSRGSRDQFMDYDIRMWRHFPQHNHFMRRFVWSSMSSPYEAPVIWSVDIFDAFSGGKELFSKLLRYQWFQTPQHSCYDWNWLRSPMQTYMHLVYYTFANDSMDKQKLASFTEHSSLLVPRHNCIFPVSVMEP